MTKYEKVLKNKIIKNNRGVCILTNTTRSKNNTSLVPKIIKEKINTLY